MLSTLSSRCFQDPKSDAHKTITELKYQYKTLKERQTKLLQKLGKEADEDPAAEHEAAPAESSCKCEAQGRDEQIMKRVRMRILNRDLSGGFMIWRRASTERARGLRIMHRARESMRMGKTVDGELGVDFGILNDLNDIDEHLVQNRFHQVHDLTD